MNKIVINEINKVFKKRDIREIIFRVESLDESYKYSYIKDRTEKTETISEKPYCIASVTKLFIATTIFLLVEEGKIDLSDKVAKYFNDSEINGISRYNGKNFTNEITVKNLLSHSSGIREYLEIKNENNKTIVDDILEEPNKYWTIKEILEIVRNGKESYFEPQNLSQKTHKARYSDTNYQLLIEIIRRVTQKEYEDVLNEKIFSPLNMQSTYLPSTKEMDSYSIWLGNDELKTNSKSLKALGDYNSTTTDLIVFFRALISNKIFNNVETFNIMKENFQTFQFGLSLLSPGWPIQYGAGMMKFSIPKFMAPFSKPVSLIGHTGASGSWLFYDQETKLIYAGTVNQITGAPIPFRLIPKIAKLFKQVLSDI